jgi:hypothetical protein
MRADNIKVAVVYETETKEVALRVSLKSARKKDLWAYRDIPLNSLNFAKLVPAVTDFLVNHLGKKYNDNLNPDECIKLVMQATKEVLAKMNGQGIKAVTNGV